MDRLITLLACFSLIGCATTHTGDIARKLPCDHIRTARSFTVYHFPCIDLRGLSDSAFYYLYIPKDGSNFDLPHPEQILSDLYSCGFEITGAWFRDFGPCHTCSPDDVVHPSSSLLEYPPEFLLQLSVADSSLEKYDFKRLTERPWVICSFTDFEYRPSSE